MSDIPRYRPVSNDRYGITDDVDGKLCEYRDYARLKAEVERLCKAGDALGDSIEIYRLKAEVDLWKLRSDNWQKLAQVTKAEVERLRASSFVTAVPVEQYERLVKAGDALVEALKDMDAITDMDSNHPEVEAWTAAKEGKPSV